MINNNIVISSQVINEFVSVTIKKEILLLEQSVKYAKEFMDIFHFSIISQKTITYSFQLMEKFKFSNWDCLIIASALENNCSILYTEDIQHGQMIEHLKIINPFIIQQIL